MSDGSVGAQAGGRGLGGALGCPISVGHITLQLFSGGHSFSGQFLWLISVGGPTAVGCWTGGLFRVGVGPGLLSSLCRGGAGVGAGSPRKDGLWSFHRMLTSPIRTSLPLARSQDVL